MSGVEGGLDRLISEEGRLETSSIVETFLKFFDSIVPLGKGPRNEFGERMTAKEVADMRVWAEKTMQSVIDANTDETMGYLSALENNRQEVPAVDALIGGMTPDRGLRDEFRNSLIDIIKTLSKNRLQ